MSERPTSRASAMGDLERRYASALERYLSGGGEDALQSAYGIGRDAVAAGRSLLEMAAMHHAAVAAVLRRPTPASREQDLGRAGEVLCECLSPYEMAQRGFQEGVQALRQLNDTLEHEIQRIAHSVHDEAGQLLVAARLAVAAVAADLSPALQERLQEIVTILDQAEKELRRISHALRPTILDDLGLVPALQFLAEGVSKGTDLSVHVESSLEGRPAPSVETALYRVVQESLTNAARHSAARNVTIRLTRDANVFHCLIDDDGTGFDVQAALSEKQGLGLVGMRERLNAVGGTLKINSELGRGTAVLVSVPVESWECRAR